MNIIVSRIDKSLPLPAYQTDGAAAFDLYSRVDITIAPGEIAWIPSNLIVATPPGHALIVALRSSMPKKKSLIIPHGFGLIDPDFNGQHDEILIQVYNIASTPVLVDRGERIAQAFVVSTPRLTLQEVEAMDQKSRGGFGSTGQ